MSKKVEDLKAQVAKAQQEADIATLYVLQEKANELFDEDTLSGFYANILDLSLEKLTNTLETCTKLDMNDVQDVATLRALYEYAMEHYHSGSHQDAAALFEVLSGITDDESFCESLKYHTKASANDIALDDFLETYADIERTEKNGTFYLSSFQKKAQELLSLPQSAGE